MNANNQRFESLFLPVQLERIGYILKDAGFNLSDFKRDLVKIENKDCAVLRYSSNNFYFQFAFPKLSNIWINYSPGKLEVDRSYVINEIDKNRFWNNQLDEMRKWVENLSRETSASNPWSSANFAKALAVHSFDKGEGSRDFTNEERCIISSQLEMIEVALRESKELSKEQLREVTDKLKYLGEASNRLNRVDWRNAAAGVILTFLFQNLLSPETQKNIVGIILELFNQLFGRFLH